MDKPLLNRVAVVTGASRGIGRAAALALAEAGAHVIALARTQGALESLDDEIRAKGSSATLVPVNLKDLDAHRPARRRDLRALGQARHPARQCRPARRARADHPYRPAGLGRGDGGERDRQLPPDPLPRSAAARLRRRPRDLHHLRRRPQAQGLLGRLFGLQGGPRGAGAHLCRRDGDDAGQGDAPQSRPAPHRPCAAPPCRARIR